MSLFEHLPAVAYATDGEGRVLLANPAFEALTGHGRDELRGRPLADVLPLSLVATTLEHEDQVRRLGMAVTRQLRVDAPPAPARTWLVTKFPWSENGESGVGTVVADVTDQVRDADTTRREAAFIRSILDHVPNLIYTKDRHRRFTFTNRAMAELMGSSPNQVLGRTELELDVHHDDVTQSERLDAEVLDGEHATLTPEEARHDSDGGQRWFRTSRRPLHTAGGTEQLLVVATDITEYRSAQRAQLRLKDERMDAIGRLAGGIAHDLNNLLTVLQSGAGILQTTLGPDTELSFVVEDIARASARAASLTQQLLAYSRRQLLRPRLVDLNEIVRAAQDDLGRLLGPTRELQLVLASELPHVLVDRDSVGQILSNLTANARDAMPDGGTLRIETRCITADLPSRDQVEVVELIVEDDGHGISSDVLERIFEPFFTTKPQGKGTGLGLSMVYGIVRQSGGDMAVTSQEGRGARFALRFPLAVEGSGAPPLGSTTP